MNTGWDSKHLGNQNVHPKESMNTEKAYYLNEPQWFYTRQKDKSTGENMWIWQLPKHNSGRLVLQASKLNNDLLTLQVFNQCSEFEKLAYEHHTESV